MATNAPATVADRLPKQGEVLTSGEHSYRLDVVLGSGAYGTVFLCYDDKGTKLAAKVEKYSKSYISTEVQVLKMANNRQCKHFCKFIDSKTLKPEYVFLVMSLAGKNLHELRAQQPEKKFSMITGLRVGLQTLEALRELHECGFVSRDVKPGNFAPGIRANGQTKTILIFDFGLAKTFRDKNGNLQPSRGVIGWRGTTRYGSLMAHQRVDLSRRDDVESWYYLLVEVTKGNLPWRLLTVREGVEKAKRMARTSMREQFLYGCPSEFGELLPIIDGLKFEDEPPYDAIMALLGTALKKAAGGQETALGLDSEDTKWDWDAEVAEDTSTRTECSGSDEKDAGEGGVDDLKKVPAVPVEPKTKPETPEATPRAATTDDKKTTPGLAAP